MRSVVVLLGLGACGRLGFGERAPDDATSDDSAACSGADQMSCLGMCVDVSSDPAHCGECGTSCSGACSGGKCVPACRTNPEYLSIGGLAHTYREVTTNDVDWAAAAEVCAADEAQLVILDNVMETLALSTDWVGITDATVEGTWLTVRGDPAPFEPWGTGEPSGGTAQNCARLDDSTNTIEARACSDVRNYTCECE